MLAKRCLILMMVLGFMLTICPGFFSEAPAQPKHKRVAITQFGSPLGSDAHNFSHALGDIINKNHPWLRISVVETMGSVDNTKSISDLRPDKRKLHIALGVDPVLNAALRGVGPFKKTGPITGWKALCTLYNTATHFMTLNPSIRNSKDLIGKRIGLVPKGHGLSKVAGFYLGPVWDILKKAKVINMPTQMLKDALLDGTVDAICSGGMYFPVEGGFKPSPFNEAVLAARKNVYYIGLSKEEFETAMAKGPHQPYTWGSVKANSLRDGYPDRDWGILRASITWYAWEDFDEEVAYEIVKTAAENAHKFKEYFDAGRAASLESFIANAWSEKRYHPGALKYYREKGLTPQGNL